MATNYSFTRPEKEQNKIQYSDLSPSLQAIIDGKVDLTAVQALSKALDDFIRFTNGIVVTIGTSFPANPTNNKHVHLNPSNRVIYLYTSSAWKPVVMIPQG